MNFVFVMLRTWNLLVAYHLAVSLSFQNCVIVDVYKFPTVLSHALKIEHCTYSKHNKR